jgi:hypothetical protein
MQSEETPRSWLPIPTASAGFWFATVSVGGLWFLLAARSAVYGVPATAAMVAAGIMWRRSRARARARAAVLDAYAEREIARAAASRRHAA